MTIRAYRDCLCTEAAIMPTCPVHAAPRFQFRGLSPDCRDGNHAKCDGVAWNLVTDTADVCRCGCGCGPQDTRAAA